MKNEIGATMVEFAISISILLMFIGLIIDVGLSLHRKSMLTNVAKEVSRLIAIRVANSADCSMIESTINEDGNRLAQNSYKVVVSSWSADWHNPTNPDINPSFSLSMTSQAPCFFVCNLYPNGLTASSSLETSVNIKWTDGAGNILPACKPVRIGAPH